MNPDATRLTPFAAPAPDDTNVTRGTHPDLTGLPDFDPPAGFELLDVVGKGGMGVVFRAREKAFDREVAVKFLLGDPPPPALAVRFVDEARITGRLQHPGIPAAYRTGLTADGRPYLAMKLIRGRTLDELLKGEKRTATHWLGIFEGICQAVGYAHAHGIIHRDLKPANVMVGAFGEVQVMDWGLAKVLTEADTSRDREGVGSESPAPSRSRLVRDDRTQAGSVLGTPAYMPPEQAGGNVDAVGPPADVFGLGGILCCLLTGRPPYVGTNARTTLDMAVWGNLADAFTRLDGCGAEPELVALCKRCLSVEPDDRPANGSAVAEAVAGLRAAADERARAAEVDRAKAAVEAAAQRKRRRLQLVGGGLLVGVLAVGMAGTGVGYLNAEEQRKQADHARGEEQKRADAEAKARKAADDATALAEQRQKEAEAETRRANQETDWAQTTLHFVQQDLIGQASSYAQTDREAVNPNLTVREALDRAAGKIDARTKGRPAMAAAFRGPIGQAFAAIGQTPKAIPLLRQAVGEAERARGPKDRFTLELRRSLADAYACDSQFDKALPQFDEVVARQTEAFGLDDRETLRTVLFQAMALRQGGRLADALTAVEAAAGRAEKAFGPDDDLTLALRLEQGSASLYVDKLDRAAELYADVLARRRKLLGDDALPTLEAMAWLGWCHVVRRQPHPAIPLFEEALKGRRKGLGDEHPHTLGSIDNLGHAYATVGRSDDALPLLEEGLRGRRKVLGPNNLKTFWSIGHLAELYARLGRLAEARELYLDGAARQKEAFGADAPNRLVHLINLTDCELKLGQPRRALPVLTEMKGAWAKRFGAGHQNDLIVLANLGQCHLDLGRPEEGAKLAGEAADGFAKKFGEGNAATLETRLLQAECELTAGHLGTARKRVHDQLPHLRKGDPNGELLATAGRLLLACGSADAESVLREAVGVLEKNQPKGWGTARAKSLLGGAVLAQKKYADAEPLLLAGYDGLMASKSLPPREWNERREAAVRVVELYTVWGKAEKAAEWRTKVPTETLPAPRAE